MTLFALCSRTATNLHFDQLVQCEEARGSGTQWSGRHDQHLVSTRATDAATFWLKTSLLLLLQGFERSLAAVESQDSLRQRKHLCESMADKLSEYRVENRVVGLRNSCCCCCLNVMNAVENAYLERSCSTWAINWWHQMHVAFSRKRALNWLEWPSFPSEPYHRNIGGYSSVIDGIFFLFFFSPFQTFTGNILVSVNPYKMFDIYGVDMVKKYENQIIGTLAP